MSGTASIAGREVGHPILAANWVKQMCVTGTVAVALCAQVTGGWTVWSVQYSRFVRYPLCVIAISVLRILVSLFFICFCSPLGEVWALLSILSVSLQYLFKEFWKVCFSSAFVPLPPPLPPIHVVTCYITNAGPAIRKQNNAKVINIKSGLLITL